MNLNFKRGKQKNLNDININPGTIYLTEDTQNIFIDDESLRFQLEDINALRFEIEEEIEFKIKKEEDSI